MYTEGLVQVGFTKDQALVYEALLKRGRCRVSELKKHVRLSRPLIYKVLDRLVEVGIVSKEEKPGSVATFATAHPLKVKTLIDKQREQADSAKNALDGLLGKLISDFNTVSGQPGVRILDGMRGVKELYEDIQNERQDMRIIRTSLSYGDLNIREFITQQVLEQAGLGIHTRVLSPISAKMTPSHIKRDPEKLIERRIIRMSTPAQVLIYANKVALISFAEPIMTTIIENVPIKETFAALFEYLWEMSAAEHEKLYAEVMARPEAE